MVRATILAVVGLGLAACDEPECVDMTLGDAGLIVTEGEHGIGWGEASCYSCHVQASLHDRGCTPGVNLRAVRDQVEAREGVAGCAACHGDNGVEVMR